MKIKKGMWVVHQGQTGIAFAVDGSAVEVHNVNESGFTFGREVVSDSALRLAEPSEIPATRRPERSSATGIRSL